MSLAVAGIAAGNSETLYVTSMGSGLLRSTDGGKSWGPSPSAPGGVQAVKVDPTSPKTVYAGAGDGIYKSLDGGDSWSKLPFPGNNVAAIAVSPAKPQVVMAIGISGRAGLVYRSDDGGLTWGKNQ